MHLLPMKAKYNSPEQRRQTFYIQEIRVLHYVMNWGIWTLLLFHYFTLKTNNMK